MGGDSARGLSGKPACLVSADARRGALADSVKGVNMGFIKRLFCLHEYRQPTFIERHRMGVLGSLNFEICDKCGKIRI